MPVNPKVLAGAVLTPAVAAVVTELTADQGSLVAAVDEVLAIIAAVAAPGKESPNNDNSSCAACATLSGLLACDQ